MTGSPQAEPDSAAPPFTVAALERANALTAEAWDSCAGTDNPSLRHAFFTALEDSGSAAPERGWRPCHLALKDRRGGLQGLLPLYLKSHSFG